MSHPASSIGPIARRAGGAARARKSALVIIASTAVLLFAVAACGGSAKKQAEEPNMDDSSEPDDDDGVAGDELMPADKLDEVQRFFDHKRTVMTRCFTSAIEAGEIAKNANGQLTISMTITPSGSLKNLRITDIKPKSQAFESCVLDTAGRWNVTTLPKALDYSFSYGFGTL